MSTRTRQEEAYRARYGEEVKACLVFILYFQINYDCYIILYLFGMTRTSSRLQQKAIKTAKKEKRGFPIDDHIHFENVSDCWKVFPQRFILEMRCDELSKYHMESEYRDTCFSFDDYIESISNSEQRKSLMDFYDVVISHGTGFEQDKKDPRYFTFHDLSTGTKTKVDITKSIPLHIKLIMARDMALIKKDDHKCLVRRVYMHNATNTEVSVADFNMFHDKKNCSITKKTPIGFDDFPDKIGRIPEDTDPRELRDSAKECINIRIQVMSKCWSDCSKNINTIRGHYNHLFKMIILGFILDKKVALSDFS